MIRYTAHILLPAFLLCLQFRSCAQVNLDTGSIFSQPILLDTFTFHSGFDVSAFIRRIQQDTTFYKAFRSMHLLSYSAKNNIIVYDKKGRDTVASLYNLTRQERKKNCRATHILKQKTTGNYYKKDGENNYYTGALFDYLFFSKEPVCYENDIVAGNLQQYGEGTMELNKYRLKQLIFNPGSRINGIPFMADHAAIFEPEEAKKYNFHISTEEYNNEPCYLLHITPKKDYANDVIYNELTTWFRKTDYSILARNYALSYHTLLYDFDVIMHVRTTQIGEKIYPSYIGYNGNWHIFTKRRERVRFSAVIDYDKP